MVGTVIYLRKGAVLAFSLLVAGCSGGSSGTISGGPPSGGGSSSGAPSGDDGAGGSSSGASSSTGGEAGGTGDDDSGGMSSSPPPNDGGSEDATHPGGSMHDAAAHDAAAVEAGSGDGGDALAAARAQCVQIINMDRATLSPASPALVEDTAEEACVDGEAQADYEANTAHSAFGNCNRESAQDECPNWPGPPSAIMTKCLAQMWAEGPPAAGQDNHWLNMSNAKYKKVACGFYQTPAGKWWATQDFY
jgi:hypothetical protein